MTGYEDNTTAITYDYSAYYNFEDEGSAPCDLDSLRDFGKVFLPAVYSLVFILGFIGNSLVVCVLVKYRNQTNLTDICLFNLALSDLLFVLMLPLFSHYSMTGGQWIFGDFMCRFASGSHNTGFYCSIFFMVVMTIDRYIVIIHTYKLARFRTLRAGVILSVVVWMLSFGISLPVFIFTNVNASDGYTCYYNPESDAWKHYNIFTTSVLGLMIPFLVMVVCYSRIIPVLMNMRSTKKHRVVKLIISIVVVFFIFWAPYNISLLLMSFMKSKLSGDKCTLEKNLRMSTTITETFAYTHCCMNPIIYAFVGQKFMRRVLQLLRECVPWIPLPGSTDLSDSSFKRSSAISRSSEVTSTFIK